MIFLIPFNKHFETRNLFIFCDIWQVILNHLFLIVLMNLLIFIYIYRKNCSHSNFGDRMRKARSAPILSKNSSEYGKTDI